MSSMRIALLSPYSWSYPGGVTRHIEALAEQFLEDGHDVRVLAPFDPPDRRSAILHRGARPQRVAMPGYLVPLGRTVGFKANGAVSNISISHYGTARMLEELRGGRYDVVHVHEPIAPAMNRLHVRIAVSEAAAWTGRRWFGGHYRIIPNGVHVDPARALASASRPIGD